MALSNDLISQFVKVTKDTDTTKKETVVYGTIIESDNTKYVQLDGSDLLTPVISTVEVADQDRVTIMIKNHSAVVTGNITSPTVRTETVNKVVDEMITVDKLNAQTARIDTLYTENVTIKKTLSANTADIETLSANNVTINQRLDANEAAIKDLDVGDLDAKYATIDRLDAIVADVDLLEADYATFKTANADKLKAVDASIESLEANKITAKDIEGKYANIDFSNISKATMESFYANSGLIQNVVVGDSTITGRLVGVTISGDLIEADTLVADKLVIKGEDGLYYKLNTDGVTTEAEQTEYNSLNGEVIIAQSITASKISVDDLVAFDATIGGFTITDDSLYSGVKSGVNNTTRGIYLDNTGQAAIGDASNYLKYYKDTDGKYKLAIAANAITFGASAKTIEDAIDEVQSSVDAVSIGGRNLYKGTGDFDSKYWSSYVGVELYEKNNAYYQVKCAGNSYLLSSTTASQGFDFSDTSKTWTISVMAKGTADGQTLGVTLDANRIGWSKKPVQNGTWKKLVWTFNGSEVLQIFRFEGTNITTENPVYLAQVKVEEGNRATDWTPAPEDVDSSVQKAQTAADNAQLTADQNATDMANIVTSFNADIDNLQTQIDGSITTWFYEVAPTTSNEPAVNWTTTDLKNVHLGDIYYNTVTGYCYRWQVQNNTYSWQRITDTDVTKALNDAKAAQDTADNKRRIFYTTPTPPYDAGDLWVQGSSGDIKHCKTTKTSGQSYSASDWVISSKYTDDTAANKAQNAADNAQADIDGLVIGGRNLIIRTQETKDYWVNASGVVESCGASYMNALSPYISVEPSTEYMLSRFDSSAADGGFFRIGWYDENKEYISRAPYAEHKVMVTSPSNAFYIRITYPYDSYPKFEKGNRATDWSPAPEDTETKLSILSDRITANVTDTTDLGMRMSTVEQTAEDITFRFESFGNRNYIAKTIFGSANEYKIYSSTGTLTRTDDGLKLTYGSDTSRNGFILPLTFDGCLVNGEKYTLSFKYRTNMTSTGTIYVLQRTTPNVNVSSGTTLTPSDTEWQTFSLTFSSSTINARICYAILIPYAIGTDTWLEIKDRSIKLERGTKATTWIPALEDGVEAATNYMNLSSAGLVVGQNPSSPSAGNVLISSNGVTIRSGTTILSEFKAASRTASGISAATLTSKDSTDSESDGSTRVSGTITTGGTRTNVYISTNGNPVYFPQGLETNKVLINDASGIISNANIVLNASLVDKSGEGILTPLNSYGNMVIGYGRYQDGGGTYVYGTLVKAKTKSGFSASVNGVAALDTNNSSGNATFGWHLYEAGTGETNIYGQITSLFSKGDMRLNAEGNVIRFNGDFVPYTGNVFNIGAASLAIRDIHINRNNDGTNHGIKFSNSSGSYNAVGINANGYPIFGNDNYCTNIVTKSTTTSSTGYSFKIICGDNPALTVDDNDARLLLFGGTDSTSRYLGSMAIYKRTYSNAGNIYITANGMMGRSTSSSRRYKKDIVDLPLDSVKGLYELPIRQFKYNEEQLAADDERYGMDIPGFIAEEVAEHFPIACDHISDANGNLVPEMWNSKIIVPALLKLIQDMNERLKKLEEGV